MFALLEKARKPDKGVRRLSVESEECFRGKDCRRTRAAANRRTGCRTRHGPDAGSGSGYRVTTLSHPVRDGLWSRFDSFTPASDP